MYTLNLLTSMALTKNFDVPIRHPVTDLSVDAVTSFYYTKGYPDSLDEPGCPDEVELISCTVDGEDVLSLMTDYEIGSIEGELLAITSTEGDNAHFDDDYDDDLYIEPT